jgi:hypothetical protein
MLTMNRLRASLSFVLIYALAMTAVLCYGPAVFVPGAHAQQGSVSQSRTLGRVNATSYNIWSIRADAGFSASGAGTFTLATAIATLPDGTQFLPFATTAPVYVADGSNSETQTPSSISNCTQGGLLDTCMVTATWTYAHGTGVRLYSGTFGLQEAINDTTARYSQGGVVVIDGNFGGTTSTITAATGAATVAIEDVRGGRPIYYTYNGSSYQLVSIANTVYDYLINPTALTNLVTKPFGAGALNVAGRTISVKEFGVYTAGTSTTLELALYLGTVSLCPITSAALTGSGVDYPWSFDATASVVATGATATLEAHCTLSIPLAGVTPSTVYNDNIKAVSSTIDLTAAQTLAVQAMFGSTNAGNRASHRLATVTLLN